MRFHMGVSFSWRTIKKYLIPIILGALAVFGFKFINDNKENLPLGFIKVNALTNYETSFNYVYPDLTSYESYGLDSNDTTLPDLLTYLSNLENVSYDYTIYIVLGSNNSISSIEFQAYKTGTNYAFSIFGYTYDRLYFINTPTNDNFSDYKYSINTISKPTDLYTNSNFTNFINCITTTSCSGSSGGTTYSYNMGWSSSTIDNNSSNTIDLLTSGKLIYYSTKDLIINNTYNVDAENTYYKSLYINDIFIDVSDKFLTYIDYKNYVPEPEPEPEPEPTPDDINHKAIFNKVYWFDDNTTEVGILSSIYILLFLYCITMVFLKILTIIKNKRW